VYSSVLFQLKPAISNAIGEMIRRNKGKVICSKFIAKTSPSYFAIFHSKKAHNLLDFLFFLKFFEKNSLNHLQCKMNFFVDGSAAFGGIKSFVLSKAEAKV